MLSASDRSLGMYGSGTLSGNFNPAEIRTRLPEA